VLTLAEDEAVAAVGTLLALRDGEQRRLNRIAQYVRGDHDSVYVPRGARAEYRWLLKRSKVNMLRLVVGVLAQNLYVDGYRPAKSDDNAAPWAIWQSNRLDARQHGIHRAALKYGIAYALVLPGDPDPVVTPMSPRRMTAFYGDPVNDEWPIYAVEVTQQQVVSGGKLAVQRLVRMFDDTDVYSFVTDEQNKNLTPNGVSAHDLGVCPVVRYCNESDLDEDESVAGEIEPLIALQDQANSTTFNLMMAQQYAAFRQRWVTGMAPDLDENGAPIEPFRSAVDRLFVAEDADTKFGEFGQTDLTGYLSSREESIRQMATVSQTPPYYLLGAVANLSAEALVAARDGLDRKTNERQSTFGESHEQMLRLAGHAAGDSAAWKDLSAEVVWRDTSTRSMAATVDALTKLAQMLAVPAQELWEKIPGVTQTEIARWKASAHQQDSLQQLSGLLDKHLANGQPAPAADAPPTALAPAGPPSPAPAVVPPAPAA
jgi:hypothetical protein